MADQQIVCTDCGATFAFTDSEQTFFAERGLAPPKRCKACRRARRYSGQRVVVRSGSPPAFPEEASSGTITAPPPQDSQRPARPRYEIRCGECGVIAQVPFKPVEGRAVYCPACYRARKGSVRQATDGVAIDESDEGIIE
jgi:CxxC-x17-CxxC domain-containing protein